MKRKQTFQMVRFCCTLSESTQFIVKKKGDGMEMIYSIIRSNPEFFAWAFGLVNVLWGIFLYFNKQSHEKAMENLKYKLKIREIEVAPIIKRLQNLELVAGEAKEVSTSFHPQKYKFEKRSIYHPKLAELAGQFSKYPKLVQAIRDFNQYCAIMAENDPHDTCRDDVYKYYDILIHEIESVNTQINA